MAYPQFTPEELETEEWRDVPNHSKQTETKSRICQASNLGRIRMVTITIMKSRHGWGNADYDFVGLSVPKPVSRSIHSLVAAAFIGPRPQGEYVNHIDGNKINNRPENLEYRTPQENTQHAYDMGLAKRGEGMGTAKLTDAQVTEIIQRLAAGEIGNDIAKDYPVSDVIISLIRRNKIWTHLPRPDGLADPLAHWAKLHPERLKYGDNNPSRSHYDLIPKGEDSHNAKITEDDVRNIRKLYASGDYYMRELADTFSISLSQTKQIIDRETWKQVD